MAAHFMALPKGVDGFQLTDYTTGTATTGTTPVIELRVDDGSFRRLEVIKALKAFARAMENPQFYDTDPAVPPSFGFVLLD
jgi:hypothetical protein